MSEVIGYILSFAILSSVLVISMLAFNSARDQAETRVAEVEAASVAHRVAEAVIQVALFQENHATSAGQILLDLPANFASGSYQIDLCTVGAADSAGVIRCTTACGTGPANAVLVTVGSSTATEALLGVIAERSCASGGLLAVEFGPGSNPRLVNA